MLNCALFGVILLALQTFGQYESQYGYPPNYYPQPDPCIPSKPLPPCPPNCQPVTPNPAPYPASYPTPYPATYQANYASSYPASNMFGPICSPTYGRSIVPIAVPVLYNSKDWSNPLRSDEKGNGDEGDDNYQPDTSNTPDRPPKRPTPPNNQPSPNQNPDQSPNKPPNRSPNQNPNDPSNQSPNQPANDPTDNNYDPPDNPSRSGRPRLLSAMVSRFPEVSVPGRASGLFSNFGSAAGNLADSIFK